MKYLVLLGIVIVLVVGVLVALRMIKTSTRKKEEWKALKRRVSLAESTIRQIDKEVDVAKTAGMGLDVFILENIITEYTVNRETPNVKELSS